MTHERSERRTRRGRLAALATATLLIVSGCGDAPTDDARAGVGSTSPTAGAPRNGSIAFSRAGAPTEGDPASAAIVAVPPDGGRPRPVAEPAVYRSAPSWSPDGEALAFTTPEGIAIARDGAIELVWPCRRSCLGVGDPAWSPDGARLAFGGSVGGGAGLVVVGIDDPQPRLVRPMELRGAPTWSPDGTEIAVLESSGAASVIVVVDAETGAVAREVDTADVVVGASIAWSPDGGRFAFDGRRPRAGRSAVGVYVVDARGGEPSLVTSCGDIACTSLGAAWSPDGSMLVFTRARCDEPGSDCFVGDIATVSIEGGRVTAVTTGAALDCCAAWGSGGT